MKTEAERRAIKSRMQKTTLGLEHTQSCQVLPDRMHLLDRMPKDLIVAEIGVAFGEFSREILARSKPKKLILIDSWQSERYESGLKKIEEDLGDRLLTGAVEIRQGLSIDVLKDLQPGSFDWAYIDTNHTYETTLQELELCAEIVGSQGRIAGHDFCTGNVVGAVPYGVVEAVEKFCSENRWEFEYLTLESHGHFSFCLKKMPS